MSTTTSTQPDLSSVKARQQQTWASGDYTAVASRIVLVSELLVETADLHAGWRVLDVACGNGNATLAAARSGTTAVGVDYVPAAAGVGARACAGRRARRGVPPRGCGGVAVRRERVRRGAVGVRRDVRA